MVERVVHNTLAKVRPWCGYLRLRRAVAKALRRSRSTFYRSIAASLLATPKLVRRGARSYWRNEGSAVSYRGVALLGEDLCFHYYGHGATELGKV